MYTTFQFTALAMGPILMLAVGWVLIWIGATRTPNQNEVLTRLLKALGGAFAAGGICLGIIVNAHVLSLFLIAAAIVITLGAIAKYYVAERQSLIWVLTVAAERNIPLESAARAFADERNDLIGRRASLLADYLEAGVPLALALTRSGCSVTPAVQLAADLGHYTGTLGVGLRRASNDLDDAEVTLRAMIEKLFYLLFLIVFGLIVVTFMMLKIIPVLAKMFEEFELELPYATTQLIRVSDALAAFWVFPLLGCCLLFAVVTLLCYVGFSPRQLPLIGRLWWSSDCALVQQWLAVAVRQNLPLGEMVRMLAAHFPQARIRRRLERASMSIDRGADWRDSLQASGILRRRESGLFKSAERVGNLAWALDEMAQSGLRRAAHRIRAWTNILFPAVLLGFGAVVLFICLGSFLPLVNLINGLT